jgi:hypothetical protein
MKLEVLFFFIFLLNTQFCVLFLYHSAYGSYVITDWAFSEHLHERNMSVNLYICSYHRPDVLCLRMKLLEYIYLLTSPWKSRVDTAYCINKYS